MRTRQTSSPRLLLEALEPRLLLSTTPTNLPDDEQLTKSDVQEILAAAASQALPTQIITVVDRDGQILGILAMSQSKPNSIPLDNSGKRDPLVSTLVKSVTRARTGAFFESHQNAFTTRTARFIIQDNFPQGVKNTGGGPLYGVQFSSLPGSDVYSGPAISGDPGGIPLYKDGVPVGGIGVAGDGSDRLARADLPYDPETLPDPKLPVTSNVNTFLDGNEETDFDEAVALAGAKEFAAPSAIQSTNSTINGLRLPFVEEAPASANPQQTYSQIISSGTARPFYATKHAAGLVLTEAPYSPQSSAQPRGSPGDPFPTTSMGGITGTLKNTDNMAAGKNQFGFVTGASHDGQNLTVKNVKQIIDQAVEEALQTRAGIRLPVGQPVRVHVAVTDTQGNILGVFDMQDGTNFSFDVAVQKARTAAFFSDNTHAFSARAIGFLSQQFFPTGINSDLQGPLYHLQNQLSLNGGFIGTGTDPLRDGITIFPGGAPLYKNGVLVGAVGVSGDGVDEDDEISFAGTKNFQAAAAIRSDHLSPVKITDFLTDKVDDLETMFDLNPTVVNQILDKLAAGLHGVQLPFQKFPRNSNLNGNS